ncbi:MAG: site-specific integrase [Thaumarchaeota archaeon]|nr:site-specific integrase [Nitrososphaerota archaeon]
MKRRVKDNTWRRSYRPAILHHVIPYFGSRSIDDVRPADVRAFLDACAEKGLHERSVAKLRMLLAAIFRSAEEEELVERNPVELVRLRARKRTAKKSFNTLTMKELHHLLDTIHEHFPEWGAFFTVMAYTGVRLSEARGLKWGSVYFGRGADDPKRCIIVRDTLTSTSLADDVTKTGKERRADLNLEARQALLDHHVAEMAAGRGQAKDYVFCRPSGTPLPEGLPTKILTKACTLAGLERITPGDFRHTYISVMLYELEEDLLYVIEQVGHSSVKMVLDHYGHPERYHRPEKVDRMGRKPATYRPSQAIDSVTTEEIRKYTPSDASCTSAAPRETSMRRGRAQSNENRRAAGMALRLIFPTTGLTGPSIS